LEESLAQLNVLDKYFDTYRKASLYDDFMRSYTFQTFLPYIQNRSLDALELGCSDGQMTEMISQNTKSLDVVEGSLRFIEDARKRNLSNITFHHTLFEKYKSPKKYDAIFATYILTHILDLGIFFEMVKQVLKDDGFLFVAVPNARVLSRQLALHMGLLEDLFLLSENDRNHGHHRCYDRVRLNSDIRANGFDLVAQGGIILKPLADFQMDKMIELGILGGAQLDGLYKLGIEFPDLCAVIYAVCKRDWK